MAEVYHNNIIDIDLESGTLFRSFLNHTIGSGDNNANWYGVRVFRKGEPIALSGCSVQGLFMPASGSAILISDGTHTWVSGNEAAVLLPQACYNVKGRFTLAIKLIGTNSYSITDTVRIVDGVVADTNSESPVAPTASVPTYQEILSVYNQMVAVKEGSVLFNSAQSLTDGQKAQARDNISCASAAEVSDLKSALNTKASQSQVDDLSDALSFPPELVWAYSDTHYIATGNSVTSIDVSSPYTESSTYHGKTDFRSCLPGDVFIVTLSAGTSSVRPYVFCDSSGNVIEKSATTAMTKKRIVAPNNAAYVGFNANGVNDSVKIGEDKFAQLDNRCNSIEDQIESIKDATIGNVSMLVFDKTSHYYVHVANSTTQIDTSAPYAYSDSYNGKSDFRQCSQGDVFVVTLTPPSASIRTYGFCSSDGAIIEKSKTGTITNERIVAPENAAYVWFNSSNSSDVVQIGEPTIDALSHELDERCSKIEQNVSDIEDSLGSVSQLVWEYTDTYYISTKTSPKDVSSPYSTSVSYHGKADWRECSPGDVFVVSLKGSANFVPYIFCDSSGNILVRASNVQYHNERIVAPIGAAYVGFNSEPSDAYGTVQIGEYVVNKLQAEVDEAVAKQFDGMTGVAFGTSLTYKAQTDNGYLQYLPDLSGITFDNRGIGSATIMSGILNAIKTYTGYSNKNVCILEGFVNDWHGNNALGNYTDDTETTVCGCVRSALNYIMSQNANITLFLILDHYGKNASIDESSTAVNGAGLTQYQYYEEIAKVAESLGIPVIKEYAGSQISENTPQYLADYIHCTALGAKQSAYFIWSQMKQYYPNQIS